MKVKTSELSGRALDHAVALSLGAAWQPASARPAFYIWPGDPVRYSMEAPSFSTAWSQAGPVIGHVKGFQLKHWLESRPESQYQAEIHNYDGDWITFGPTALIAAMRCFVISKFGDEIDLPQEVIDIS